MYYQSGGRSGGQTIPLPLDTSYRGELKREDSTQGFAYQGALTGGEVALLTQPATVVPSSNGWITDVDLTTLGVPTDALGIIFEIYNTNIYTSYRSALRHPDSSEAIHSSHRVRASAHIYGYCPVSSGLVDWYVENTALRLNVKGYFQEPNVTISLEPFYLNIGVPEVNLTSQFKTIKRKKN